MGYDVHITRADDWADNEGREITASQWHDVIERDSELRLAGYNGEHFAIWDRHPSDTEAWLDWCDGNITTKNPDEPLLAKMLEIAARLGAKVQGDDGELYPVSAPLPSLWSNGPFLSFVFSIVTLLAVVSAIAVDASIREHYPVGTPVPLGWALLLTGISAVGVISWLVGSVIAIASLIFRQPAWHLACSALGVNAGIVIALLFGH
jgi:hypothetical protein